VIKILKIKNFASHRETTLKFSTGITGIIGLSQSGKTSILRAFKWLSKNRPAGFGFHSYFAETKTTDVSIVLNDGTKIERDKNTYEVDGIKFKKFGRSVPDKIVEKLNINELNLQEQLDSPFLITSSSGEIAKIINRITNSEKIDAWIKEITKEINRLNTEERVYTSDLEEYKETLKPLEKLEGVEKDIRKYKKLTQLNNKLSEKYFDLEEIKQAIEKNKNEAISERKIETIKKDIEKLKKLKQENNNLIELKQLLKSINTKKTGIKNCNKEIKKLESKYIRYLKTSKKCPVCFSSLTNARMQEIANEIRSSK
jgi:DNA repair exonuclease SbcCD ATPase subunit